MSAMRQIGGLVYVLALGLWVTGCESRQEVQFKRALAENPQREKAGMRKIEPSWTFHTVVGGDEYWLEPRSTITTKWVKHDANGKLSEEVDDYVSGRWIEDLDNKYQEEIKIACDFVHTQHEVVYLGDDKEIKTWVEEAGKDKAKCLEVIERVKAKWFPPNSR